MSVNARGTGLALGREFMANLPFVSGNSGCEIETEDGNGRVDYSDRVRLCDAKWVVAQPQPRDAFEAGAAELFDSLKGSSWFGSALIVAFNSDVSASRYFRANGSLLRSLDFVRPFVTRGAVVSSGTTLTLYSPGAAPSPESAVLRLKEPSGPICTAGLIHRAADGLKFYGPAR